MVQEIQELLGKEEIQMHLAAGNWVYFEASHILAKVDPKKFKQAVEEIAIEHLQPLGFEVSVRHVYYYINFANRSKIYLRRPKAKAQKRLLQKLLGGLSSLFQAEVLT
jgi:hypothetical protein